MNKALTQAPVLCGIATFRLCAVLMEAQQLLSLPFLTAPVVYCVASLIISAHAACVCVRAHTRVHCQALKQHHQSPPLSGLVLLIVAAKLQPDESRAEEAGLIAGNEVSTLFHFFQFFFPAMRLSLFVLAAFFPAVCCSDGRSLQALHPGKAPRLIEASCLCVWSGAAPAAHRFRVHVRQQNSVRGMNEILG